jgi:hypothetical protein
MLSGGSDVWPESLIEDQYAKRFVIGDWRNGL